MTPDTPPPPAAPRPSRWRVAVWSAAALVLLAPLVAMQFTDEVAWTMTDFMVAAALLLSVGIPLDILMRRSGNRAYRAAAAIALGTAFLLVWVNLAVGIIGAEGTGVNLLFFGVVAVGVVGALLARFRPLGMARALAATALAQAVVAVGALVAGWASPATGWVEIVALWGLVALWAASAVLFRGSARGEPGQAPA